MFESVNTLAKRMPAPVWTGDVVKDSLVIDQHIANSRRLRSEAFLCLGRGVVAWFRNGTRRAASLIAASPAHQVSRPSHQV